jgi:hypothetical protein
LIDSGWTFAVVPPRTQQDRLYDFEGGGVVPQEAPPVTTATGAVAREVSDTDAQLARAIAARLCVGGRTFIVQDWYSSPTDGWLVANEDRPWTFDQEVYFATGAPDVDAISSLLTYGNDIWPGLLGLVTDFDSSAIPAGDFALTADMLDALAGGARELIVGSYDGESYLLWTDDADVASDYAAALTARS